MTEFFEPTLPDLQAALPQWLAVQDPHSETYKLLAALAALNDELVDVVEGIHADQALSTARDDALRTEWALLWGASHEQLPLDTETLRDYLQQRAADDGSTSALVSTLLALLRNPTNDNGTPLQFPIGGAGLLFPANGSGIGPLWQPSAERAGLYFPADGSGLQFPADGSGLQFPNVVGRLEVIDHPGLHFIEVHVREWLVFDRALFARAVQRARMADDLPPTITETPA